MARLDRRAVAKLGEDAAAQYLANVGYAIVARNYRCHAGEIDIVARHGTELIFVEVRARSGSGFGTPEESVTRTKSTKMAACALEYLAEHAASGSTWRIDFVGVDVSAGRITHLRHLRHAVE